MGEKLKAGQYEPHRWGGGGLWKTFFDGFKPRQKWIWIKPPRGYRVENGNLIREVEPPTEIHDTTQAAESARALEEHEN